MRTSYKIEPDTLSINLYVHIPLLREKEVMQMIQYTPSQIPISEKLGINIADHHDILAYDSKHFITLQASDLHKCQQIATLHFCNDVINSLKPLDEMKDNCLGSLKLENTKNASKKHFLIQLCKGL